VEKIANNLLFDKEELIKNLKIARMSIYYKDFVKKSLILAGIFSVVINLIILFIFLSMAKDTGKYSILYWMIFIVPFSFYILFRFFIKTPEIKIIRSRKNIDAEVISTIRFIILDFKANASVFEALQNVAKNFDECGRYIKDVITKVKLGDSLEDALEQVAEKVPSENFRVVIWQLINHLQTGTDITNALDTIVNEIEQKQRIEFRKYGKKLNVLSLFYMIIAIILPTIGFTIISAGLIFIGFPINMPLILAFWMLFTIMQIMFLVLGGENRPVTEL
jgi:pilus assembly protein TadC